MSMHVKPGDLLVPSTKLFKPTPPTSAYLKMGLAGFAGGGKSKTAGIIARGMVKLARELRLPYADKPVFMLDTETGSDFLRKDFAADGIDFVPLKTRAFSDLAPAIKEAQNDASILIVDSETHFWREFCSTYQKQRAAKLRTEIYRLQMLDWGYLKGTWNDQYTTAYVNSPLHIIKTGRGAFEYDLVADAEGHKELQKTDVRMASEKESAFEPSLLVWMEQGERDMQTMQTHRIGSVLKDRADVIDGHQFRNPTFENFLPHVKALNLGGHHVGFDAERTSAGILPSDGRNSPAYRATRRAILIDEVNDLLLRHGASGTSEAAKKKRSDLMLNHFKTVSKTAIEETLPELDLRMGYESLHQELEQRPSKYASTPITEKVPLAVDLKDGIPEFLKRELPETEIPNWISEFAGT